jgi:hypothetical protein
MNRGQLPADCCRPTGDRLERLSGRTTICRNTPSHIMSPPGTNPGPRTEVSLGVRGHTQPINSAATAPVKRSALGPPGRPPGDRAPPLALPGNEVAEEKNGAPLGHLKPTSIGPRS